MDFELSADERGMVEFVEGLVQRYFAASAFTWPTSKEYLWDHLRILAEHGLTGMLVDEADGGQGQSIVNTLLAQEAISKVCPHTGDVFHSANFRGVLHVARHGSAELKERILGSVLRGERLMALGMTEADAGSATGDMRTTARGLGDGSRVLKGSKIFNSDAPFASYWLVWAKFVEPGSGIGTLVVEREFEGLQVDGSYEWMFGAPHGTLYFDDCVVPSGNIVSDALAMRELFDVHNVERLSNAIRSVALGELALTLAREYALERTQNGRRIADYQGIRWKIADMQVKVDAARLLTYRAAANADRRNGRTSRLESSIAKLYANRAAFEVADEAMAIFGGSGMSSEAPINFLFRRSRGLLIGGGTPEIIRNGIAREILDKGRSVGWAKG